MTSEPATISINLRQLFAELKTKTHEQPGAEWFTIKDFAKSNDKPHRTCERVLSQYAAKGLLGKKLFFVGGRMVVHYRHVIQ